MRRSVTNSVASIVLAAGKGSRMIGYDGNKTLLPLIPTVSLYEGEHPLLFEVLENLPLGPKGVIVHHRAEDVRESTKDFGVTYIFQPDTNGTGGALLAARPFLESLSQEVVIITMGDVPLIRSSTYGELVKALQTHELMVLAFNPRDRAQYGMLETVGERVLRIVEWNYWHKYSLDRQKKLRLCNAGVYAARRLTLIRYLDRLAGQPHKVQKALEERWVTIEEYFLTDLVELMSTDGLEIGAVVAPYEEVVGVDTPEALKYVQCRYRKLCSMPDAG